MSHVHPHRRRPFGDGETRWVRPLDRVQISATTVQRLGPPEGIEASPLPARAQARAEPQSETWPTEVLIHHDGEIRLEKARPVDPQPEEAPIEENSVRQHLLRGALDILNGVEPP